MNKIQDNMRKISCYQKMISSAYSENDAQRFNELSRDLKICFANLFIELNKRLYAEIRKDVMTFGVGCISIFEEAFSETWGKDLSPNSLTDEQLDALVEWNEARDKIFDKLNDILYKYQKLLLEENNGKGK